MDIARPPALIANGDFENGLKAWRIVSGTAFAKQPVAASSVRSQDVRINGRPLVGLGGDYWYTPFPIGDHGGHLIRVVSKTAGILESAPFSIGKRFIAYRLGGSAGGGAAIELRVRAKAARAAHVKALDAPDADGYVAVRIATPSGSDVLAEATWDLAAKGTQRTLVGAGAKIRLRVAGGKGPPRLLVDHIRLVDKRPPPFHPPLWGWADIHCHPMAQAGFGDVLSGHMHGPVEDLGSCLPLHGHEHGNPLHPVALFLEGGRTNDGSLATTGWTTGTPGPDDQMGFRGWPAWDEITHIKTHQAWIRRAYEGGQRLMVALIVHNQMLASLSTATKGVFEAQSDRDTVEPQLQLLREFVVHNSDWCGLAKTPTDARKLIGANKMAFVLGLETDSINGWVRSTDFPVSDPKVVHDQIHGYFTYLHDLGVVQVNLIHLSDNAFGGMALYDVMFMINSWQRRGILPATEDGFSVHANPDERISTPVELKSLLWEKAEHALNQLGFSPPTPSGIGVYGQGDRNASGLTFAGKQAVLEAMRFGMVIDMDHMSEKSSEDAHAIVTGKLTDGPYPLVSAHNGARKLAPRPPPMKPTALTTPGPGERRAEHTWPSESMKSETQLGWIIETKGMFGHGIAGSDSLGYGTLVPNDCPGSSKTVAQGLQYLMAKLEMPVAFGTDWNALLPGPSPRFGPRAASGLLGELEPDDVWAQFARVERLTDSLLQTSGVVYQGPLRDWRPFRFPDSGLYDETQFKGEGRFIWQALALLESGVDLRRADVAAACAEPGYPEAPALELALGLAGNPALPGNVLSDFNKAGAWFRMSPGVPHPEAHVDHLVGGIRMIRDRWTTMRATGATPAMTRSTAGPQRDFDYNLDGLSHYGMLPDMLQDLKNVGLTTDHFGKLFSSAQRYIEVWEKSVAVGSGIPHP